MRAIRLGFTGMGHIPVHAHLPALAPLVESGEVVLQAFCDLNVEAAQEQAKITRLRLEKFLIQFNLHLDGTLLKYWIEEMKTLVKKNKKSLMKF